MALLYNEPYEPPAPVKVKMWLGAFVMLCIDNGWPAESTLREAQNLFPTEHPDLPSYVATMYEIFKKEL